MVNFLYDLLLMGISGTLMYLISLLLGGRMRYAWLRYAALIAAVLLMLVPVQRMLRIPALVQVSVPEHLLVSGGYAVAGSAASPVTVSVIGIIFAIWALGAAASFIRLIYSYSRSAAALRQITDECHDEHTLTRFWEICGQLNVSGRVTLRTSRYLNSPMLFGLIKPVVIIPDRAFTDRELEMIITHELMHYKHSDLYIAILAAAAKCLHWYDPAVYLIERSIITARELCCDEAVLELLSPGSKKEYGSLILSVIETAANSRFSYTTSMASSKVSIQRRLLKIIEFRTRSRLFKLGCLILVGSLAVSSVTAFGFEIVAEIIPEEIKEELSEPISLADSADALSSVIMREEVPEETAAPSIEPEETAPPEEDAPEPVDADTEEMLNTDTGSMPESEAAEYYPETYIINELPTAVAEPEAAAPEPEYRTVDLSASSFLFKPDFSGSDAVRSDYFEVPAGVQTTITKYCAEGSDLRIEIYNAGTDELFTGEEEVTSRKTITFMKNTNEKYYIIAYCTTGGCDGIYVSGRNMYR